MGGILVGVLAAVCGAHQIQDLIIVVLPVCPVQAQSTLGFFRMTSKNHEIGMTGLTSGQRSKDRSLRQLLQVSAFQMQELPKAAIF